MPGKILCVAEKNSISKAVAGHLSGGQYRTVSTSCACKVQIRDPTKIHSQQNTRNQYIKNYTFDFDFGPPWGNCNVVMTCVSGHLTSPDFDEGFRDWNYPPPDSLFEAPLRVKVDKVHTRLCPV